MRYCLLGFLLWSAACGAQVRVLDDEQRAVQLPEPATRIIALAPHIVENLYAAGAGDHLVAAVSYSDFPRPASDLPRVGSSSAISLESVVALQPDLVILWGSGNNPATRAALEALGVPVFVSEPRTLAGIAHTLRRFGALAGTTARAEAAAADFEAAITRLRERHAAAPDLTLLLQIWHQPLQTVGGQHLLNEVMAVCGGLNAFADTRVVAPTLNLEAVLARNPDVIVATGAGHGRPAWLDMWEDYPTLSATRQRAVFHIDPDHLLRPTPRLALGTATLCDRLDQVRTARAQEKAAAETRDGRQG
jgi:iron complex transport system substrate-binding protein